MKIDVRGSNFEPRGLYSFINELHKGTLCASAHGKTNQTPMAHMQGISNEPTDRSNTDVQRRTFMSHPPVSTNYIGLLI